MSTQRKLNLSDLALRPIPGMTLPSQVSFSPSGDHLYYLAPQAGDSLALFAFDIARREERLVLAVPSADETLEEELRKQRLRQTMGGIGSFQIVDEVSALVNVGGAFQLVDLGTGDVIDGFDFSGARQLIKVGVDRFVATTGDEIVLVGRDCSREILVAAAGDGMSVGVAEYVAQEELGRMTGMWLDPSGRWLAYTEVDESKVDQHHIVRTDLHPNVVERYRYPMVGATNASVVLCLLDLETHTRTVVESVDADRYLANVVWLDTDRLAVSSLNRQQDRLNRWVYRVSDGVRLPLGQEYGQPWVNLAEREFAIDGDLLTTSEADRRQRHLVRIHADGTRTQLGELVIRELLGVQGMTALVVATGDSPTEEWLYRVDLIGGHCERIGTEYGVATGVLAPRGDNVYISASSKSLKPRAMVSTPDGRSVSIAQTSAPFLVAEPEMIELESASGETLYGAVYLPSPERIEGAPLIVSVYGGPHAQLVVNHYGLTLDLQAQYLASRGAVVVKLDNRGSYGRSLDFEAYLHRRFGEIELSDQLRGVAYCQRRWRLDSDRVGIYGWSYGGYMTLMAMTRASEVFKVGVAGAPVVDFRWYDTAYTERYLGDPVDNQEGYERSSVLDKLERLSGKLMVIHGLMDENVHFGHTSSLIARANELGKDIELVVLPSSRHAPTDQASLLRVATSRTRFLLSNLGLPDDSLN
ncbi:S9 family peptidase [Ferrimicrobium acidiphilum]|uniref:S9 family peptidase n=1 Tax=Ferrimicrobium acidiphilum TaxID=121039 RepID=UPI0023F2117D|nr:prolyl oligopeptidase family serine peptidase [Ferrimicrobium acidiphilum]